MTLCEWKRARERESVSACKFARVQDKSSPIVKVKVLKMSDWSPSSMQRCVPLKLEQNDFKMKLKPSKNPTLTLKIDSYNRFNYIGLNFFNTLFPLTFQNPL